MSACHLRRRARAFAALLAGLLALLPAVACSDDGEERLTVYAAASLTDVFSEVGDAFEDANPGVDVRLNFAGSSQLALQITEGAPADVFASANETQMQVVVDSGDADDPVIFATNALVIAVPAGSDAVGALRDLASPGVRLVLAAEDVPVGDLAREMLQNTAASSDYGTEFPGAVLDNVVSFESDVRAVLVKVQLGEADAGIVYQTDVAAAGDAVDVVEIPAAFNVVTGYPIATTARAASSDAARAFIDYVLSAEGQAILARHGFGPAVES